MGEALNLYPYISVCKIPKTHTPLHAATSAIRRNYAVRGKHVAVSLFSKKTARLVHYARRYSDKTDDDDDAVRCIAYAPSS